MNVFEKLQTNYNYYPNAAIELSIIAYEDMKAIPGSVNDRPTLELDVCWGPAQLTGDLWQSYSKMFVAKNSSTGEYWVAIQGTDFYSLEAWTGEDFDIGTLAAFADLPGNPPNVPADAMLSQGTFNGVSDLLSLKDPTTGQSVVDFLQQEQPKYIYVTGHSLGGTLTPPMFAYLNAMLYGGEPVHNMALWSFAGLTPGDTGFNAYLNSILPNNQDFLWRIQNSLDIAPLLWVSKSEVENIYQNQSPPLTWDEPWSSALDFLFFEAANCGGTYAQPQVGLVIPGNYNASASSWYEEASAQHSSLNTYQGLVNGYYPYPPFKRTKI